MTVKSGQSWAGLFVTLNAEGALEACTPTGKLYVNGTANVATVTISGSNPYKFSVTLPTLSAGQRVDMYITATISGIATAAIVASEQADTVILSDGVTLANDAITAAKFDESTAFPLKSADTGSTRVARVGADGDTLKTLSDEIAAVKTDTAAILVDTGTTLDGLIKDVPTVAEFNARTKPAADYFDPTTDTVANVTAVGTTTNLTKLPTMPANWITASGLKSDAVAEIQNGLALEATLQAIRGASGDTLETLSNEIAAKMASSEVIEGTYTLKDAIRIILAFAAGKVSGGGTSSIKFRSTGDDVDRIQATVDAYGNRTAVTLNPNDPV